MAITITIGITVYEPWETTDDGDSFREVQSRDTDHYVIHDDEIAEHVAEGGTLAGLVADVLTNRPMDDLTAVHASVWPLVHVNRHTWYSAEPYEDPCSGELTEKSYHLDGPEWTTELAQQVAAIAKWNM